MFRDGWMHVQSHTGLHIRHLAGQHLCQQKAELPHGGLATKEAVVRIELRWAVVLSA